MFARQTCKQYYWKALALYTQLAQDVLQHAPVSEKSKDVLLHSTKTFLAAVTE